MAKKRAPLPPPEWLVMVSNVLREIRSQDRPTRKMALVFAASLFGIAMVSLAALIHFKHKLYSPGKRNAMLAEKEAVERILKAEKEAKDKKLTLFRLGTFGVAMKDVPGSKPLPGVVNMAELEIYLQCDSSETCQRIESSQVQVRDLVAPLLGPIDREELMSLNGKEKLKIRIGDKINDWLPNGKLEKVFFSRLLID